MCARGQGDREGKGGMGGARGRGRTQDLTNKGAAGIARQMCERGEGQQAGTGGRGRAGNRKSAGWPGGGPVESLGSPPHRPGAGSVRMTPGPRGEGGGEGRAAMVVMSLSMAVMAVKPMVVMSVNSTSSPEHRGRDAGWGRWLGGQARGVQVRAAWEYDNGKSVGARGSVHTYTCTRWRSRGSRAVTVVLGCPG